MRLWLCAGPRPHIPEKRAVIRTALSPAIKFCCRRSDLKSRQDSRACTGNPDSLTEKRFDFVCVVRKIVSFFAGKGMPVALRCTVQWNVQGIEPVCNANRTNRFACEGSWGNQQASPAHSAGRAAGVPQDSVETSTESIRPAPARWTHTSCSCRSRRPPECGCCPRCP